MRTWKKSWNVDIPSIDNQHVNMIKAINALEGFLGEKRIHFDINKLIRALSKYTKVHFSHEEIMMKQVEFPMYDEHKQEHLDFKEKLLIFETQALNKDIPDQVIQDFCDYLNRWLVFHILNSDRKYVDIFKQHQLK